VGTTRHGGDEVTMRGILCIGLVACSNGPAGSDHPSDARDSGDAPVAQLDGATTEVDTESCTHTASFGGTNANYAEHAYPGKTVVDLSGLVVRFHIVDGNGFTLPGYDHELSVPYIKDGFAAAICGYTTVQYFDSVDFILPP